MSMRLLQVFLLLVDQVTCRGIVFFAGVSVIFKRKQTNPRIIQAFLLRSCKLCQEQNLYPFRDLSAFCMCYWVNL